MLQNGNNVMRSIVMNRKELLEIVKNNKQKHIDAFEEAYENFLLVLDKTIVYNNKIGKKMIKSGKVEMKQFKSLPTIPSSYESSYDKAIKMLELSVGDEVTIESDVFNQLVLDEWSWKASFVGLASSYIS